MEKSKTLWLATATLLLLTTLLPNVAKADSQSLQLRQTDGKIETVNQDEESMKNDVDDGVWRKTIIVSTLEGTTMEYLIDKNTKVRIDKPNLIIETEGVVLTYELESMGQVRYGKKFIPSGIHNVTDDNQPFVWDDETMSFDNLPDNTLVEIYKADGTQVVSRKCSRNTQLSLKTLTNGVYIVKIDQTTYKILKR